MPLVRQIDIAQAAGVSRSAVSLALSDHPSIPATTRLRIQKIARDLGYERDPMLSALVTYREEKRRKTFHGTLAMIASTDIVEARKRGPGRSEMSRNRYAFCEMDILQGEAVRLGYKVEFFNVGVHAKEQRRWSEILHSRGIRGLVVWEGPVAPEEMNFLWEKFSVVKLSGQRLTTPFAWISGNPSAGILQAMDELAARGYRRPVLCQSHDDTVGLRVRADYLLRRETHPGMLPPQRFGTAKELVRWCQRHKPDAVIATSNGRLVEDFAKAGIRIPEDLGYCDLHLGNVAETEVSGLRPNFERHTIEAVRMLDTLLRHGQRGPANPPVHLQVTPSWIEARTLRQADKTPSL